VGEGYRWNAQLSVGIKMKPAGNAGMDYNQVGLDAFIRQTQFAGAGKESQRVFAFHIKPQGVSAVPDDLLQQIASSSYNPIVNGPGLDESAVFFYNAALHAALAHFRD
jgi:hypothetical protein